MGGGVYWGGFGEGGGGSREASTGGAPALAGHDTACGEVWTGVLFNPRMRIACRTRLFQAKMRF